ncbi:MAG TPA: hypothetical protein VF960_05740, partial [Chloroflexota bacterium]
MTDTTFASKHAPPVAGSKRSERVYLLALLCLGLLLRLVLLPLDGYQVDVTLFTEWTNALRKIPLNEYYGLVSPWCDYLPGYLYLLGATDWLKSLVSGPAELTVRDFQPWIKAGPVIADLILVVLVYTISRRFSGPRRALIAASLVALNPGIIFVSSVWGQVESIATA